MYAVTTQPMATALRLNSLAMKGMATLMPEPMNGVKNEDTIETARAVRRRDLSDTGVVSVAAILPVIIEQEGAKS
jgi:hypothetical protein